MAETAMAAHTGQPAAVQTKKWSMEPAMRRKRASPVKATEGTPQAFHSRPTCTSPIIEDVTKVSSPRSTISTSSSPVVPLSVERASPSDYNVCAQRKEEQREEGVTSSTTSQCPPKAHTKAPLLAVQGGVRVSVAPVECARQWLWLLHL